MAQIVTDYDLSGGSTVVVAGTNVNNMRFQYQITGATAGQQVHLRPLCSEDDVEYDNVLNENKEPFNFIIEGNTEGTRNSKQIFVIGSAYVSLEILCDDCTGTLNVYTYES